MSENTPPVPQQRGEALAQRQSSRAPAESDFWHQYGWNTTYSLCVGIGSFGVLKLLLGLLYWPTYPFVNALATLALFTAGPLILAAGITGFALPIHSLVRHYWFDDERLIE